MIFKFLKRNIPIKKIIQIEKIHNRLETKWFDCDNFFFLNPMFEIVINLTGIAYRKNDFFQFNFCILLFSIFSFNSQTKIVI